MIFINEFSVLPLFLKNAAINLFHLMQVKEQFPISQRFSNLKINSKTSGGKSLIETAILDTILVS